MRYLITGGSGYIGGRLVEALVASGSGVEILICDVRPPRVFRPGVSYRAVDVRDARAVSDAVSSFEPDAVVHLAFVLNPIRDEALMYDIDVGGTHNVLSACSSGGVEQVLVTSSSTAYGAFPDNPVPLTESDPVRGVAAFEYARDKAEADRLCQLWALEHPDRVMTIVRPCIVFGPSVDNYLVRLWTRQPFQADLGMGDPGIQFVHEDDVVSALVTLLGGRFAGAFNVAGDGVLPVAECAALIGLPRRRVPLSVMRRFASLMWRARASEAPPGSLQFAMYSWIVSNEKLKRETGWEPRYSSLETFEITMRAHGKLPDGGPVAAAPTPAAAA